MAKPINSSSEIKKMNHTRIYRLIYQENGGISKQELIRELGLSLPTVAQKLQQLQEEGLVRDSGSVGNTGGRRARLYSAVEDARLAVGVDIGREGFTAVLVDLKGNVICREQRPVAFSREESYYMRLSQSVRDLIGSAGVPYDKILGVGFGVPGLVTRDNERVFYGKILDFDGVRLEEFSQFLPFPCRLYNDAKAAGFAELWNRADLENAFYMLLSSHIGGAVIYHHQVDLGENTHAGEIGHLTIVPFGKKCYCGRLGCVEPYCSAEVLSEKTGGDLDAFFQGLRAGVPELQDIWKEYLYFLVLAVNNVNMLFDCPVILGGKIGAYLEDYVDELRELARKNNPFAANAEYLAVCRYKVEAIAAGAALPFVDEFLRRI